MIFKQWLDLKPESIPVNMPLSQKIENYIEPEAKILDVGCASGRLYDFFKSRKCRYYGIDVNESAIQEAKKRYGTETFQVNDAEKMNFSNSFFDIVIAQGTFACMDLNGRINTLREVTRVAKNNAILHITELNLLDDGPYYETQQRKTGEYGTVVERQDGSSIGYTTHHFSPQELRDLLYPDWDIAIEEHLLVNTRNGNLYPSHRIIAQRRSNYVR